MPCCCSQGNKMTESSQATSFHWRKSTHCVQTTCVEVASRREAVFIRDSSAEDSAVLRVSADCWLGFMSDVANQSLQ